MIFCKYHYFINNNLNKLIDLLYSQTKLTCIHSLDIDINFIIMIYFLIVIVV